MAQQNPSQAPILSNPIPQAGSTPGLARLALLTLLSTTTVQPTTKVCEKCQQDDTATEGDRERRQVPKIEYCQLDQTNAPHVIRFTSKQMNDHLRGNFHQPAQAFLRFVKKNGGGQYQPEPDSKYKAKYRYKCGWCSLALPKNYQLEKHVLEKHLGEFPKEGPVREYIVACGTDKVKACQGNASEEMSPLASPGVNYNFPRTTSWTSLGTSTLLGRPPVGSRLVSRPRMPTTFSQLWIFSTWISIVTSQMTMPQASRHFNLMACSIPESLMLKQQIDIVKIAASRDQPKIWRKHPLFAGFRGGRQDSAGLLVLLNTKFKVSSLLTLIPCSLTHGSSMSLSGPNPGAQSSQAYRPSTRRRQPVRQK